MLKKNIQEKLLRNPFVRRVSVLVGGTAIGQLIAILALPILTRLYGPEAFSALAVYVSILSMLTVVAGLCFEYAIPLPKSNRTAAALCVIALLSVICFTFLTVLVVLFFSDILNLLTKQKIASFLWFIPLGVFAVGMYNVLQYWSTRQKKFSLIAKTRVTQSISGTAAKLGIGYVINVSPLGLIFGQLIAQGAGFLSLGRSLVKNDWRVFRQLKCAHLKKAFKKYNKFPKFTVLETYANVAGIQLPIMLIAYYSPTAEAGYLMIAMQLLAIPMSLIGSAVSQVYLAEGAERYRTGTLGVFTKNTIRNLAKIALAPLLLLAIIAPWLMPYILGEEWQRTGVLISWMSPWFFMQFIASPISIVLYITGEQITAMCLQIFGVILRCGFVLLAVIYSNDQIGEFYAISGLIFYSIYLIVILKILSRTKCYKNIEGHDDK